jgi:hypothetical protein
MVPGGDFWQVSYIQEMKAYQYYLGVIAQGQGKELDWIVSEFDKEFGAGCWREIF